MDKKSNAPIGGETQGSSRLTRPVESHSASTIQRHPKWNQQGQALHIFSTLCIITDNHHWRAAIGIIHFSRGIAPVSPETDSISLNQRCNRTSRLFLGILFVAGAFAELPPCLGATTAQNSPWTAGDSSGVVVEFRGVDVAAFPEISVLIEVRSKYNTPRDSVFSLIQLKARESGIPVPFTLTRASQEKRMPIDFIFVLDETGSMQREIDDVKENIYHFADEMARRAINYRLGLITFSDTVDTIYGFTHDAERFIGWIAAIQPFGGGDEKENSLEALNATLELPRRPGALRVVILITDAPFHQRGEMEDGTTTFTADSMGALLRNSYVRTYCVAPLEVPPFRGIAGATGGKVFDVRSDFSAVLDEVARSSSSLWTLLYRHQGPSSQDTTTFELEDALQKETLLTVRIPLLSTGQRLVSRYPLFEFDKATLSSQYIPDLERVVMVLKENPSLSIRVEGHADEIGSDEYNMDLSVRRARAVRDFLMSEGMDGQRIEVKGFGKRRPVAPNDTEEGRQKNRRVEFTILRP